MPQLERIGAYCGVSTFRAACNLEDTTRDATILRHLKAASRQIEQLTIRAFFPYTGTTYYRYPSYSVQNSWTVYLNDDLLTLTLLQAQASGQNAAPVTLTHYFLEPNWSARYSRIEIDLSSSDVLTAGATAQRSIAVTGQWGYCNSTVPVGTLSAPLGLTDTSLSTANAVAIEAGDVLLIDNEAIFVDLPLWAGAPVLRRGANGTTATTHLAAAAISKYEAPSDIQRVVLADAIGTFQADQASWGRQIGAGEMQVEWQGKAIKSLRQQVVENYRRSRTAAI